MRNNEGFRYLVIPLILRSVLGLNQCPVVSPWKEQAKILCGTGLDFHQLIPQSSWLKWYITKLQFDYFQQFIFLLDKIYYLRGRFKRPVDIVGPDTKNLLWLQCILWFPVLLFLIGTSSFRLIVDHSRYIGSALIQIPDHRRAGQQLAAVLLLSLCKDIGDQNEKL